MRASSPSMVRQKRSIFVDSLLDQSSTARDHESLDRSGVVTRRLNDGREFRIVKICYEPVELERRLAALGWHGWIRSSGQFFVYGSSNRIGRRYESHPGDIRP
jgi:hypothetical protein